MTLFREIPKVDKLLNMREFEGFKRALLSKKIKEVLGQLKEDIRAQKVLHVDIEQIITDIKKAYNEVTNDKTKPLINATGVVLHTNLGRSVLSNELLTRANKKLTSYTNLEYNLEEGKRGQRYSHLTSLFSELLGVEDVLVVNNNAAAVFLVLNTFAKDKEVVVSRGELVEIGGGFRVPEVMAQSGARLVEVGTTNKTHVSDYVSGEDTAMFMKVHQSNFCMEGFTKEVSLGELISLAKEQGVLDYYDLGSGCAVSLPFGLDRFEKPLKEIFELNPSLVSFSGDKLFGSVQAGVIAGKKGLIEKLKKNQLLRMLRVDKLTISLLEESLKSYILEEYEALPTIRLLTQSVEELKQKAKNIQEIFPLHVDIVSSKTYVGGGALPNKTLPTVALSVKGDARVWERVFRENLLIGRIEEDRFLIDLRSVVDMDEVKEVCKKVFA